MEGVFRTLKKNGRLELAQKKRSLRKGLGLFAHPIK